MSQRLVITKPDDFHCHLRTGYILESVIGFTANQFKRALIMPNTVPPIYGPIRISEYRQEIIKNTSDGFEPLMTIYINNSTTPDLVARSKDAGAIAGKLYPQGVTTNSQNGVTNIRALYPVFEKMQEVGMILSLHGEDSDPKTFCMERELLFLPTVFVLSENFPNLKIVLEHITTRDAVEMILRLPQNIAATITAHHLAITLDDVVGGLISPHNFCKPIAKKPDDRKALLEAATSGNPKFFFGSDSAPHPKEKKECSCGCAGVFSAPVALPLLAQIFEQQNALGKMQDFVAKFGANFYGLLHNTETIGLIKKDWVVPQEYNGIVPFMAGQTLHWEVL